MSKTESLRNRILDFIRREPGQRTVQVADRLDEDFTLVDEELQRMAAAQELQAHAVTAPNGRKAVAWTLPGIASWTVPGGTNVPSVPGDAPKRTVKSDEGEPHQAVVPAANASPVKIAGASFPTSILSLAQTKENAEGGKQEDSAAEKEKEAPAANVPTGRRPGVMAVRAISYLRHHAVANDDELKKVMGISYSPMAVMRFPLKAGWVKRIGKEWSLGRTSIELTSDELLNAALPKQHQAERSPSKGHRLGGAQGSTVGAASDLNPPSYAFEVPSPNGFFVMGPNGEAVWRACIQISDNPSHSIAGEDLAPEISADDELVGSVLPKHLSSEEFLGFLKGNAVMHVMSIKDLGDKHSQAAAKFLRFMEVAADQGSN